MSRRIFLIVLDSFGVGELPDAADFHDEGSNTLASVAKSPVFHTPNMKRAGLFNIDGVNCAQPEKEPRGAYGRMAEQSRGKDTTTGHWELAGLISHRPMPTYPDGFPKEIIEEFSRRTGRGVLCNKPYSGVQVIHDYGQQHLETGALIVYTSADSVFQVAAHEKIVPVPELYQYCEIARSILTGENAVGRVIARPFVGEYPNFVRTPNRHDISLPPPRETALDYIAGAGLDCIGVGKIFDIFAGKGITRQIKTVSNDDGMEKTLALAKEDFSGLCFVNLVEFDMVYGHRNDVDGYAGALTRFDRQLGELLACLRDDDFVIVTADHGCDPATPSTDHSREYVPVLVMGKRVRSGNLHTRPTFADLGATVLDLLHVSGATDGVSFADRILS